MAGEIYLTGLTNTGFDYEAYLSKLAELKSIPIQQMQTQQEELIAKQTSIVEIKSALANFTSPLSTLQDSTIYDKLNAKVTNSDIASVSVDGATAQTGSYDLEVVQTAKESSFLISPANSVTDVNAALPDSGTLTIDYKKDGVATSLNIDYTGKSLSDIVNEINNSTDLKATIVNNGTTTAPDYKILVTSNTTGTANEIVGISDSDGDDTTGFDVANSYQTVAAQDAQIKINGILFTNSTDTFSDVLSGVTVTANEVGATTFTIEQDFSAIESSLDSIIKAYNTLKDTINNATAKGQPLSGEASLNTITKTIFDKISSALAPYGILDTIGEGEDATGYLTLNSDKLNELLNNSDFDAKSFFENFSRDLEQYVNSYSDNMTLTNTKYLEQTQRLEDDINEKTQRLQEELEALRIRYAKLDVYLSELQNTQLSIQNFSAYLSGNTDGTN